MFAVLVWIGFGHSFFSWAASLGFILLPANYLLAKIWFSFVGGFLFLFFVCLGFFFWSFFFFFFFWGFFCFGFFGFFWVFLLYKLTIYGPNQVILCIVRNKNTYYNIFFVIKLPPTIRD